MNLWKTLGFCSLFVGLGLGLGACSPTPATPTGAVRAPVDFAFACEGAGQTQLPTLDERATSLDNARLCPDIELSDGRTVEGHGIGALLSGSPPGVILLQTNPHSSGGRRVLRGRLVNRLFCGRRVGLAHRRGRHPVFLVAVVLRGNQG